MHLSVRVIALTLEVNLQMSFKEACAASSHKGIRRLLPALITPEKTALKKKRRNCDHTASRTSVSLSRFISVKLNHDVLTIILIGIKRRLCNFSFKSPFKKPFGAYRDYHAQTRGARLSSFFHRFKPWLPVSGKGERLKKCFCGKTLNARSLLSTCESTFLFKHTRTRSLSLSSISTWLLCRHAVIQRYRVCVESSCCALSDQYISKQNQRIKYISPPACILPSQLKKNI